MMVLNNFSSEQMDAFLAFFREEAIPSVSLKETVRLKYIFSFLVEGEEMEMKLMIRNLFT